MTLQGSRSRSPVGGWPCAAILAGLLLLGVQVAGAQEGNVGRVSDLLGKVRSEVRAGLLPVGRVREAVDEFNRLSESDRLHLRAELAQTLRGLVGSKSYSPRKTLQEAELLLRLDTAMPVGTGGVRARLSRLALDYRQIGSAHYHPPRNYARSLQYHARAIDLARRSGDRTVLARCIAGRAVVRNYRGEIRHAIDDWRAVLQTLPPGANDALACTAHASLGEWLVTRGDLDTGRAHLEAALRLTTRRDPLITDWREWRGNRKTRADCLAAIADYHRRVGQPETALKYYKDACSDGKVSAWTTYIMFYVEMAEIHAALPGPHHRRKAERLFEMAFGQNRIDDDAWIAVHSRIGYGGYLARQGRFSDGIQLLEEALAISRRHGILAHQASCLLRMGHAYLSKRPAEPRRALEHFEACRRLVEANVPIPDLRWRMYHGRARALAAMRKHRAALGEYERALRVVEEWLHGVPAGGESPASVDFTLWSPFEEAIALSLQVGETDRAFHIAERFKGGLLARAFNHADLQRGMAREEVDEERRLASAVEERRAAYASRALMEADSTGGSAGWHRSDLGKKLRQAESVYAEHRMRLYGRHPHLRAARGDLRPADIRSARAVAARQQTVLVSYLILPDRVAAFVADASKVTRHLLPVSPAALRKQVSSLERYYRDAAQLPASRSVTYPRLAGELYASLVSPLEPRLAGAQALCVIPDGPIWNVPFELLWGEEKERGRYLVERFPITYAPSVAALEYLGRPVSRSPALRTAAAVMDPRASPGAGPRLVRAAHGSAELALDEVGTLTRLFPTRLIRPGRATSVAALEALRTSWLVHFACHGTYDDRRPLRSRLRLADDLPAERLANADIRSELVVLGACETGRGQETRGRVWWG